MIGNTQLSHGEGNEYVRQAQSLYFMEQASLFIRNILMKSMEEEKKKKKKEKVPVLQSQVDREKKELLDKGIPFIMGCDLNTNPDGAAFDVLIGKDIFEVNSTWRQPEGCTAE